MPLVEIGTRKVEDHSSTDLDHRPCLPSSFLHVFVSGVCKRSAGLQAPVAHVAWVLGFRANLVWICAEP